MTDSNAWTRNEQPIISAMTTGEPWCNVQVYSPTVIRHGGRYRMWYTGNASRTRTFDMSLGYAESDDGFTWTPYVGNPILTGEDLPFGKAWQTPHVMFDEELGRFRMWFVSAGGEVDAQNTKVLRTQRLGYAESEDGIAWDIHPEPICDSARRPCVIKDAPDAYRMWANSAPAPENAFEGLIANIYRFTSSDGLNWTRDSEPCLTPGEGQGSVVYPFVLARDGGLTMWYGAHTEPGVFEVFRSESADGLTWTHHRDAPDFPATRRHHHFDGRYTSTPCVLDEGDRLLMYYSARDWGMLYRAGDGAMGVDRQGIYRHIGVAVREA